MNKQVLQSLTHNWKRKLIALTSALILWLFINSTITSTKTISNIPIRVINLPQDKTISGLLPNGVLNRRLTLTLSGTKDIIDELEPADLAVVLDANTIDGDEWIVRISKKNLISLNPEIDLKRHIQQVDHTEFIISLSPIVTEEVPVFIQKPKGSPPKGYDFLDIWPKDLTHTITGPMEEVEKLKAKGLKFFFNLNDITKNELDKILNREDFHDGTELIYNVPKNWKKVFIPLQGRGMESLNDAKADELKIVFLKKALIPLETDITLSTYFPLRQSETLNPSTLLIAPSNDLLIQNRIPRLTLPLFVKNVSDLFVAVIKDSLQIVIIARPDKITNQLPWSLEVIDPRGLEEKYISIWATRTKDSLTQSNLDTLRERFREYMNRLSLFKSNGDQLQLVPTIEDHSIQIKIVN